MFASVFKVSLLLALFLGIQAAEKTKVCLWINDSCDGKALKCLDDVKLGKCTLFSLGLYTIVTKKGSKYEARIFTDADCEEEIADFSGAPEKCNDAVLRGINGSWEVTVTGGAAADDDKVYKKACFYSDSKCSKDESCNTIKNGKCGSFDLNDEVEVNGKITGGDFQAYVESGCKKVLKSLKFSNAGKCKKATYKGDSYYVKFA